MKNEMKVKKLTKSHERAIELYDLLVEFRETKTGGLTRPQVHAVREQRNLGVWSDGQFDHAVQYLRDWLGDHSEDNWTLPSEPQGWHEPWVYQLLNGAQVEPSAAAKDGKKWVVVQFNYITRRLTTLRSVLKVVVKATDGRTAQGKVARVLLKTITRALEDVAEVLAQEYTDEFELVSR